ncbi:hypothetical protein KPH14_002560 [Odynerus spinipes]|uniref:Uncharacterized protein n=1 Tax=Odynerus spinipes TaxID=1348599 RepID=A0AAD9VS35_9HYME|nr:hypothetical protein KPH14_002560 [Odynerus spinipes]
MSSLNNFYYAQYATSSESEPGYDSDNVEAWEVLKNSPTNAHFVRIIEEINDKRALHDNWKNWLQGDTVAEVKKEIEEECNMKVRLRERKVVYIYRPQLSNDVKLFKFKIALCYNGVLCKWFFSMGYSFLPDALEIQQITKYFTYHPVGPRIRKIIQKIKKMIDAFMESYAYIFKFTEKVEEKYPRIEFEVNQFHTNLRMLLMEKAWPKSIDKISPADMLIINFTFDENLEVDNIDFEYIFSEESPVSEDTKKMYVDFLWEQLSIFFKLPLYEAFIHFMEE